MMKTLILLLLIGGISMCSMLFPDEKLTLPRKEYTGNELRTDGYYYVFSEETNTTAVYFLYRNGIILSAGGYFSHDLDKIEKEIVNYNAKSKSDWGVFIVNRDSIQQEKWVGSITSRPVAYRLVYWGNIENDTTIHFTKKFYSESGETRTIDEVWRFKPFSPKPDSTNRFIQ